MSQGLNTIQTDHAENRALLLSSIREGILRSGPKHPKLFVTAFSTSARCIIHISIDSANIDPWSEAQVFSQSMGSDFAVAGVLKAKG